MSTRRSRLVPLASLVLAGLFGGCTPSLAAQRAPSLDASPRPADDSRELPVRRLRPERGTFETYSGIRDSLRAIITVERDWRELWDRLNADTRPTATPPAIDWTREMVAVAALGRRSSGGFAIRIDSAYARHDTLEIVVRIDAPGRNCMLSAAFTQPVDVARLPRPASPLPIRFREYTRVEPCD